ncbi:Uncharacterised protein [Bordetella pertussis]|nr:Uncharacterised protein [Bordetella pertussis]
MAVTRVVSSAQIGRCQDISSSAITMPWIGG